MSVPDERNSLDERLGRLWVDRNVVYKAESFIPL